MNKQYDENKIQKIVLDTFLELVSFDTQSDYESDLMPSTTSQTSFAHYLKKLCISIGIKDVNVDKFSYVYGTIPSNISDNEYEENKFPKIGFISHMDTSPDCSGKNVNPNIFSSYDGKDINLKNNITISSKEFPVLKNYIGQTIITADGSTLLGADDKAGIAEILTAMKFIIDGNFKHGTIKICFTPDEEIGKGANNFDVKKFDCDYAYTIDGGGIGELNYETFNAARAIINFKGKSVHPGSAKNIMKNASLIASKFISMLPNDEVPENTDGRDGFYHLTSISGNVENACLNYIIRDFDKIKFQQRKDKLFDFIKKINDLYSNSANIEIYDEYYNMYDIIKNNMVSVERAKKAMENIGIIPNIQPVRGGTDGSRLSFMGLPCPNIFTGGHNFHGPFEFIPAESMKSAVEVIIGLSKIR